MSTAIVHVPIDDLVSVAEKLAPSSMLPEKLRNKPHDVLAIVMAGRELGLQPWASIRMLSIIEGRPILSADGMVGLIRGSGKCADWTMVESTDKIATFETTRKDGKPQRLSFTIEEAKTAGLLSKSNWKNFPAAMLRARAQAALARMVYQDVLAGIYSDDEAAEFSRAPTIAATYDGPLEEVDELAWQLKVSACADVDQLKALRAEFDALPDGPAKQRIAELISKRRSVLVREYADQMAGGAQ